MRDENGTETSPTPSQRGRRRRTLANITNLSLSASWASSDGPGRFKSASAKKSSGAREAELLEENAELRALLAEKEAAHVERVEQIQKQCLAQVDQMQRECFSQLRRHAQVNEELIVYNSRLSKDAGQARDQLKLLQHEYAQMTIVYRVNVGEMQAKLAESQELVARLLPRSPTDRAGPPAVRISGRPRRGVAAARRSSHQHPQLVQDPQLPAEDDCDASSKADKEKLGEGGKRSSDFGRRPTMQPKRTHQQQQQQQAQNSNSVTESSAAAAAPQSRVVQHPNLYGDLIGLEPMLENICEDESPRKSSTSASSSNTGEESSRSGASDLTTAAPPATVAAAPPVATAPPAAPATSAAKRGQSRTGSKVANHRLGPTEAASASTAVASSHFSRRVPCSSSSGNGGVSGRPVRKAAEKVTSYVEPPLNIKMRRPY